MTVSKNGIAVLVHGNVILNLYMRICYRDATSHTAKKFLMGFVKKVPFKIKSIQIDGG
jgi:hypothetical protein